MKIYIFQNNIIGGYSFVVLATSKKEAWQLIQDQIDQHEYYRQYDEFVDDIRNYSISSRDTDSSKLLAVWSD